MKAGWRLANFMAVSSDTRWRGIFVLAESLNRGRWTWRGIDFLIEISRTSYGRVEISGRRGGGEIVGRWDCMGFVQAGNFRVGIDGVVSR